MFFDEGLKSKKDDEFCGERPVNDAVLLCYLVCFRDFLRCAGPKKFFAEGRETLVEREKVRR